MNSDLFLAILSMDAYNRPGDTPSPTTVALVLPSTADYMIGDAYLYAQTTQSDIPGDSFFAQVYDWNGSTVISFRGTDDKSLTADPLTGWVTGIGAYGAQAYDAAALYKQLNGGSTTANSAFMLTGDSLGGGLAGFVGEVYGDKAVVFNNMPFELAASILYFNATNPAIDPYTELPIPGSYRDQDARDFYYNDSPTLPSETNIYGYAVTGEILQGLFHLRSKQTAPVTNLMWVGNDFRHLLAYRACR